MTRPFVFDYLLFLLAPLITYFCSKIQIFAPQSNYVVANSTPAASDALLRTKYIEIYANHKLALEFALGTGTLCMLHLVYCAAAFWRDPSHTRNLGRTEVETFSASGDHKTAKEARTSWAGVINVCQSERPDRRTHQFAIIAFSASKCDIPAYDDIEMKDMPDPAPDLTRSSFPPGPSDIGSCIQGKAGEDDGAWKSVYCEEWTSDLNHHYAAVEAVERCTTRD